MQRYSYRKSLNGTLPQIVTVKKESGLPLNENAVKLFQLGLLFKCSCLPISWYEAVGRTIHSCNILCGDREQLKLANLKSHKTKHTKSYISTWFIHESFHKNICNFKMASPFFYKCCRPDMLFGVRDSCQLNVSFWNLKHNS